MFAFFKKSLLLNFVLLIAVGIALSSAVAMVRHALSLRSESLFQQSKIEELRKKKAELESSLAELETSRALEREAKGRLNLKLSGEQVVVVVPPQKELDTGSRASFISRLGGFLKKIFRRHE